VRILQISNKAPFPANDGSSIAIYNMAKGLCANGVDLHLLTINTKKHFKADDKVPSEFKKNSHYQSVYKNTNTSVIGAFLNLFSTQSYFVSRFHFRAFKNALVTKLQELDFDIVQLEGLFMASYIPLIRQYSKAKIVLRAHNVEHHIWERHINTARNPVQLVYLSFQNARLRKFELHVLSQIDALVPISSNDEKWFVKANPQLTVFTCITGVDIKDYQALKDTPKKPATVFSFGSMDWLPNQEAAKWFLKNCWKQVLAAVPEARLIIAGRGMPLDFFHITEPQVSIVENVENAGLFFAQHQIMIVPLHSGSGLRIKIVEGMAYGKAIVSTTVGAEGIAVVDGQEMMVANEAHEFANAVIKLLKDDTYRQQVEINAAVFAEKHFNNEVIVSSLVQFYKNCWHA
jgi:glycosyltransferase involved in cell wall biosynthesis